MSDTIFAQMHEQSEHALPFTRVIAGLPPSVPFVAPEALERIHGTSIRLRLGANESVFGASPLAVSAMRDAVAETHWYGDPESHDLIRALADTYNVSPDNVLVGNGIDGLLGYIVRAFVEPGANVVTTLGTYPTFNYHVTALGGALHRVPYTQDHLNLQGLLDAVEKYEARLVYIANPDNPSGTWQTSANLTAFIEQLPDNCVLLLDEAYHEFAPANSLVPINPQRLNVVHVRTFSKAHGMAGARIGYAIGHHDLIGTMGKFRNQFEVARISQAGALASLRDREFVASVIAQVQRGRQDYHNLAANLGLGSIASATNFVCIDVGSAQRARDLQQALLLRGVFVRTPVAPPLDRCVRVTVGRPDERAKFAELFADLVRRT